jgi:hypothetical protein
MEKNKMACLKSGQAYRGTLIWIGGPDDTCPALSGTTLLEER